MKQRYRQWAGSPEGTLEDPTRCIQEVWEQSRMIHAYQCLRKRGFGPDGLYCRQHAKKHSVQVINVLPNDGGQR